MTSAIADLPPLREIIAIHGLNAKKSLGQNFLLDPGLLDRIAGIPGELTDALVYEVGPGPGGLTRALLRAGAHVIAAEHDTRCVDALAGLVDAAKGRLRVVATDAMKVSEPALLGGKAHVVANLPYNVGTALLVRWLELENWPPWWKSLTLMFQREVAERIVAQPGTSAYGRLSVLAQWRSHPRIELTLPPGAFIPPPKVSSAVVHIVPRNASAGISASVMARLTAAAFGQRRKMLRSGLKGLEGASEALQSAGIDASRRAETLGVHEFVRIARALGTSS